MGLFFHIFWTSVVPILALVAVGFILDKKFNLDLRSLSKLNFFILLPAYVFRSLYTANLTLESVGTIPSVPLSSYFPTVTWP